MVFWQYGMQCLSVIIQPSTGRRTESLLPKPNHASPLPATDLNTQFSGDWQFHKLASQTARKGRYNSYLQGHAQANNSLSNHVTFGDMLCRKPHPVTGVTGVRPTQHSKAPRLRNPSYVAEKSLYNSYNKRLLVCSTCMARPNTVPCHATGSGSANGWSGPAGQDREAASRDLLCGKLQPANPRCDSGSVGLCAQGQCVM